MSNRLYIVKGVNGEEFTLGEDAYRLYDVKDENNRVHLMTENEYVFACTTCTGTYTIIKELEGYKNEYGN